MNKFWTENSGAVALVLAFFAVIQPWVIVLWRKFFKNPQIEIYPSGNIEIGFNDFGAMIGVQGVVLAINEDVFIKSIRLKIRNLKSEEEHYFTWLGFRSPAIVFNPAEASPMELPTGFIVNKTHPYRFNIAFYDSDLKKELNSYLQLLSQSAVDIARENQLKLARGSANWAHIYNLVYDQYANTLEYQNALNQLNKSCYWKPGLYEVEIQIDTNKGNTEFTKILTFELGEEEENNLLRNNKIIVDNPFRAIAGEPASLFYFAYTVLKDC